MAEPDNYNYPQFFTATILEWKHLMSADAYKDIVLNSLLFLKNEKSIVVYGFVIMPNHIHCCGRFSVVSSGMSSK